LEKTEPFQPEKLVCRKYSQNLTQFSKGNHVIDALASNTDGFLSRDACVASTQLSWLIWNNRAFFHLEKP
jgi:hypothetical protein